MESSGIKSLNVGPLPMDCYTNEQLRKVAVEIRILAAGLPENIRTSYDPFAPISYYKTLIGLGLARTLPGIMLNAIALTAAILENNERTPKRYVEEAFIASLLPELMAGYDINPEQEEVAVIIILKMARSVKRFES